MDDDLSDPLGPSAPILPASAADLPPAGVAAATGGGAVLGGGAFEGANRFDALATWQPSIRSADAELLPDKPILDARVRDTLRNDAYVAGGATLHKDNIVGSLFLLNAKPETKILWGAEDETWEREFQEEVESKFTLWAESQSHWADAARINTLTGLVRLAVGVYTAGGEVLASAEWMPNDGRPFRSAIQMIDTDRLSTPPDRFGKSNIRGGVERDRRGAPIAYHVRMAHPSDYAYGNLDIDAFRWRRVMAHKPGWGRRNILHVYEQNRPDQSRGIAAMVAALMEMKMTKGFRKVELQRAVVAATYAASIESDLPGADVYAAMGADATTGNPSTQWAMDYLAAVNEYSGGAKNLLIDGAKIPVFMPGNASQTPVARQQRADGRQVRAVVASPHRRAARRDLRAVEPRLHEHELFQRPRRDGRDVEVHAGPQEDGRGRDRGFHLPALAGGGDQRGRDHDAPAQERPELLRRTQRRSLRRRASGSARVRVRSIR